MGFRDAFIIRKQVVVAPSAPAEKGSAVAASDTAPSPAPSGQGVFLSAQSLVSFPIATGVVGFLWKLYQHFQPHSSDLVVLYLSLGVGLLIFLISISDANARPKGLILWIVSVVIALINSCFLAASALGLVKGVLGPQLGS